MKKVKVMLTAIAVLAIVGGSLAFKASKGPIPRKCYFSTSDLQQQNCPFVSITKAQTGVGAAVRATTFGVTTTQAGGPEVCTKVEGNTTVIVNPELEQPCNIVNTTTEL